MKDRQLPDELVFKYLFPDDYNPAFANGVHGGITPSGEVVLHFYMERQGLPNKVTHRLEPDGRLGEQIARDPEDLHHSFVRYVVGGVVLTETGARAVRDWLDEKIRALEEFRSAKETRAAEPTASQEETD